MARSMSLHVGINRVSVNAFSAQGLTGCENDAAAMRDIALSPNVGFQPEDVKMLLGQDATFQNVNDEILRAAGLLLDPGDTFLFTFAGHGSRIPDAERLLSDEPDRQDEALVLFDRLLLDDYLRRVLWPKFNPGVRIIGVADSCHSATALFALPMLSIDMVEHLSLAMSDGTVTVAHVESVSTVRRCTEVKNLEPTIRAEPLVVDEEEVVAAVGLRGRAISPNARRDHRDVRFSSFYDSLNIPPLASAPAVQADLLFMAACEDGAETRDDFPHGVFTEALLEAWNGGAFSGSYVTFLEDIKNRVQARFPEQVPVLKPDTLPTFSAEKPFTI